MTDRPVVTLTVSSTDPKHAEAAMTVVVAGLTWLGHTLRPVPPCQAPGIVAPLIRDFRAAGGSFRIQNAEPVAEAERPALVEFANMVARIRNDGETAGGISNDAALDELEKVIGFARSIVGDPGYPEAGS